MEWHHSLMLSRDPVSAEDFPFTISLPVLFSSPHEEELVFQPLRTKSRNEWRRCLQGPEEQRALPHLHLSWCLVLCFEWIPWASEGRLVLQSVLLVLCTALLWNIDLCERCKNSAMGMPWTARCTWGTDHISSPLKDLACSLELCWEVLSNYISTLCSM